MWRYAFVAVLALLMTSMASAQDRFRATLSGADEVPPVTTKATGWATFTLNQDNTITYCVTTTGLAGTEAHIHAGAPGVRGPILFTLSGGPSVWSGTTTALLPNDYSSMQELGVYIDVHTTAFPDGEIRGQVVNG